MSRQTLRGQVFAYAEERAMNEIAIAGSATEASEEASTDIPSPDALIAADDLVEEVSIDGMCGVY
jgi:mycofactocin precursor